MRSCRLSLHGFAAEADLPCLLLCFPGPASYTGEDMVELHCLSSPLILERVAASLVLEGLRLAQPGEFTRRAFENGKLGLEQAQAVLAVINAGTEEALRAAEQLAAQGKDAIGDCLRSRLVSMLSILESGLDFEAGDTGEVPTALWSAELDALHADLASLKEDLGQIQAASSLPTFLLLGPPNAGKTSLWNAVSDPDLSLSRGLVSGHAGTTRDLRWTHVADAGFLLGDSPGRIAWTGSASGSASDAQELEILHGELSRADAIVWLVPWSKEPQDPPAELAERVVLRVLAKSDRCDDETRQKELEARGWLSISAHDGQGLEEFTSRLLDCGREGSAELEGRMDLAGRYGLAWAALNRAVRARDEDSLPECIADEVKLALALLAPEHASGLPEEVLDRIFASFCLGK